LYRRTTFAINPAIAPNPTNQAEFNFHLHKQTTDIATNPIVTQSTTEARPSCHATTAIKASDATLTPFRNAPATADFRICLIKCPLAATNKNAGRKIPTVATVAPGNPPNKNPTNVAVVNTGPGVICPTATASISCPSLNQPYRTTRADRRNASSTY